MVRTISAFTIGRVRKQAEAQMVHEVIVYRPTSEPLFDKATGLNTAGSAKAIYRGPARIWSSSGPQVIDFGEADFTYQTTYVSLPWDATPMPHRDDIVYVKTAADQDTYLTARAFRVLDVEIGGQMRATRKLTVTRMEEGQHFTWIDP